jgi:hypothetical protein
MATRKMRARVDGGHEVYEVCHPAEVPVYAVGFRWQTLQGRGLPRSASITHKSLLPGGLNWRRPIFVRLAV